MYKGKKVAVVIPAYNEQRLIKPTLEHVPKTVDHVYVIDDCSTDNMCEVIKAIIKKDKRIELLRHRKNRGVGQAIITGYMKAVKDNYDYIVVIGGDHQMDLTDLPNFLEPLYKGKADYVKGNRFLLGGNAYRDMPKQRFIGNSLLSFITKFASGCWKIFDSQDGYTATTKEAIKRVNWRQAWKGYGYVGDWLVLLNAYNVRIMDVPRRAIYLKGERQSQIKIGRYVLRVFPRMIRMFFWRLKMRLYLDFHPFILFYMFSLILLPVGLLFSLWVGWNGLTGHVSGNQATLAALLLILGFQSFLFAMLFDMEDSRSR